MIGGQARFADAHTVETCEDSGAKHRLTADAFVIAVGARPYHPPDVDFTHPRIFDSDTILDLSIHAAVDHDLRRRRDWLRIRVDVSQPGVKVNLVNTRASCWSSSTTRSSTP